MATLQVFNAASVALIGLAFSMRVPPELSFPKNQATKTNRYIARLSHLNSGNSHELLVEQPICSCIACRRQFLLESSGRIYVRSPRLDFRKSSVTRTLRGWYVRLAYRPQAAVSKSVIAQRNSGNNSTSLPCSRSSLISQSASSAAPIPFRAALRKASALEIIGLPSKAIIQEVNDTTRERRANLNLVECTSRKANRRPNQLGACFAPVMNATASDIV